MGEYQIGRDYQDLRCRIERLESVFGKDRAAPSRESAGVAAPHRAHSGVAEHPPAVWELEKHERLSPLILTLLRLPQSGGHQYDIAPQSKTWTCTPDPLVLFVNWNAGGSDEFYRLVNQTFTITKYSNPNTGIVTAEAYYYATLIASGKAKSSQVGQLYLDDSRFNLNVRNIQGAPLLQFPRNYSISCQDNYLFSCGGNFDPGLYDLIGGATWSIDGEREIFRC